MSIVWDITMKNINTNLPKTYRKVEEDLFPLHLSIPPYRYKYEKVVLLGDGTFVHIRPVSVEDGPGLKRFFEALSCESIFSRFGQCRLNLTSDFLAQICRVDFDRDYTFLAVVREDKEIIVGNVQLNRLADCESAELSLIVADNWQGRDIGNHLMDFAMVVAKQIGFSTLFMEVMQSNTPMKRLSYKYDFHPLPCNNEGDIEEVLQLKIDRNEDTSSAANQKSDSRWRNRLIFNGDFRKGPVFSAPSLHEVACS